MQPQDNVAAGFLFEGLGMLGNVDQGGACQGIGRPFSRVEHERFEGMAFPAGKAMPLFLHGQIKTAPVSGAHDPPFNFRRTAYSPRWGGIGAVSHTAEPSFLPGFLSG